MMIFKKLPDGTWQKSGEILPTENLYTIAVDAEKRERAVYPCADAIQEVENRIKQGTESYRFELAMPPASLKPTAIPGWTEAEEKEIARLQETEGISRKSAIQKMRRTARGLDIISVYARHAPPKATAKAPAPKPAPKAKAPAKAKKSGKKETPSERRKRFLAQGICGACEKRKRAPKPASKGGGQYAECRECHEYYSQKSKEYAKAAKKGGK
jgi:hypothetical protein